MLQEISRNLPGSQDLDIINFCNSGQFLGTTKKTPEDIHTFFECGSGAIARTEIVNN